MWKKALNTKARAIWRIMKEAFINQARCPKALFKDDVYVYCGPEANHYLVEQIETNGHYSNGHPLKLEMYFAVKQRAWKDVLQAINEGMRQMMANGEQERILYRKWFVTNCGDEDRDKPILSPPRRRHRPHAPYTNRPNGAAVLTMSAPLLVQMWKTQNRALILAPCARL